MFCYILEMAQSYFSLCLSLVCLGMEKYNIFLILHALLEQSKYQSPK